VQRLRLRILPNLERALIPFPQLCASADRRLRQSRPPQRRLRITPIGCAQLHDNGLCRRGARSPGDEVKGSSEPFIRDNSAKVEQWIVMLSNGEIDKEEFDDLIAD
jgi:hypothetical protein